MNSNYSFEKSAALLGISTEVFKRIFLKFLDTFEEKLELLKTDIDNNDFASITILSHKLKGSSANLNLLDLSELFKQIEVTSKAQKEDTYTNELNKISKIYLALRELI